MIEEIQESPEPIRARANYDQEIMSLESEDGNMVLLSFDSIAELASLAEE